MPFQLEFPGDQGAEPMTKLVIVESIDVEESTSTVPPLRDPDALPVPEIYPTADLSIIFDETLPRVRDVPIPVACNSLEVFFTK